MQEWKLHSFPEAVHHYIKHYIINRIHIFKLEYVLVFLTCITDSGMGAVLSIYPLNNVLVAVVDQMKQVRHYMDVNHSTHTHTASNTKGIKKETSVTVKFLFYQAHLKCCYMYSSYKNCNSRF